MFANIFAVSGVFAVISVCVDGFYGGMILWEFTTSLVIINRPCEAVAVGV
jgi:hypothetical protein